MPKVGTNTDFNKPRSRFNLSKNDIITIGTDEFVPVWNKSIKPGETINLGVHGYLRYNNMLLPVMDRFELTKLVVYTKYKDVYEDADKIYGARDSEDDTNTYRYPYITNQTIFTINTKESTKRASYIQLNTNALDKDDTVYNDYINAYSTLTGDGDFSAVQQESGLIKREFTQDNKTFYIRENFKAWNCQRILETTITDYTGAKEAIQGASFGANMLLTRPKINGLYERIYGVVGDGIKAVNALPPMVYYFNWDNLCRDETKCYRAMATDARIDKNKYMVGGFICNKWDEEQWVLSQMLCFPLAWSYKNISDNSNVYALQNKYWNQKRFINPNNNTHDYKNMARDFMAAHQGIAPVMKNPDYFLLATEEPQDGEPIEIESDFSIKDAKVDTTIETDDNFKLKNTQVSMLDNRTIKSNSDGRLYQDGLAGFLSYDSGLKANTTLGDITSQAITTTEQIREKFAAEIYSRKSNIAGLRYADRIKAMYGLTINDDRQGLPLVLHVSREQFDHYEVYQNSQTTNDSPQGNMTANGLMEVNIPNITFTAPDAGHIFIYFIIRQKKQRYQERYCKDNFRFEEEDLVNPIFALLGDQGIKNYEVYNPMQGIIRGKGEDRPYNPQRPILDAMGVAWKGSILKTLAGHNNMEPSKKAFNYLGFQDRYGDEKHEFDTVHGMMKSRAENINSIDPTVDYQAQPDQYIAQLMGATKYPRQINTGSLDSWHHATDKDNEVVNVPNDEDWDDGLQTSYDELNYNFVKSMSPWERASYYLDYQPFYGYLDFKYKSDKELPVVSLPGMSNYL